MVMCVNVFCVHGEVAFNTKVNKTAIFHTFSQGKSGSVSVAGDASFSHNYWCAHQKEDDTQRTRAVSIDGDDFVIESSFMC